MRLVGFLSCFRTKEESSVECSRRPQKQPTLLRTTKWRCMNKTEWPVWLSGDRTKASYSVFKGPSAAVWQSVQQHWESEWKGSENTKWAQCCRRCHCASQPRIKSISQQEKGHFFSGILRKSPKPPEDETAEQVKTIFVCQNLQEPANTHWLNQHHFPIITIEYVNMWESQKLWFQLSLLLLIDWLSLHQDSQLLQAGQSDSTGAKNETTKVRRLQWLDEGEGESVVHCYTTRLHQSVFALQFARVEISLSKGDARY